MGHGCTRPEDRVAASKGAIESAPTLFTAMKDVQNGGVLLAIPALLANGLLRHLTEYFTFPKGYYSIHHIFITLAFMSLLRLKSPENIRRVSPGEFGKLLGLDRVPEVKTLREKLKILSDQKTGSKWSANIAKDWMEDDPEMAGTLYIDGHVRPYFGNQTKLPYRYASNQSLCLRGTTDYWVNDTLGLPFFAVSKTENAGLLATLEHDIIPRLERDIPNQPSENELANNPYLARFMIVFDREGFSPKFFQLCWEKRISICTYRKYVSDKWEDEEFETVKVTLSNGEIEDMKLAERGTYLGKTLWVREIRKLTKTGHQTAIVTTNFTTEKGALASQMFSRWCQENYFKYMMEHYGIDRLVEYETEEIDETILVVNPEYRAVASQIQSLAQKIHRCKVKLHDFEIDESLPLSQKERAVRRKAELYEEIEFKENDLEKLKEKRKGISRKVMIQDLPVEEKFRALSKEKKSIVDTVKMIAYRAETAMAVIAREEMSHKDEARALVCQLFTTDADIEPDYKNKTLTILLHTLTNRSFDKIAMRLCEKINLTETIYPGTDLKLIVKLVANENP